MIHITRENIALTLFPFVIVAQQLSVDVLLRIARANGIAELDGELQHIDRFDVVIGFFVVL